MLVDKPLSDKSCPQVIRIKNLRSLKSALTNPGAFPSTPRQLQQARDNGAWGPIYNLEPYPLSNYGLPNNNTGAVGTGYNILKAGAATSTWCLLSVAPSACASCTLCVDLQQCGPGQSPPVCVTGVLVAGPNAFSKSPTGMDQGLMFASIFSTNLGYNLGSANTYTCGWAAFNSQHLLTGSNCIRCISLHWANGPAETA